MVSLLDAGALDRIHAGSLLIPADVGNFAREHAEERKVAPPEWTE
jgi:hypothetical protein